MNLELNYEGFEQYLLRKTKLCSGIQYLFKFPNFYGASVIKHYGSFGNRNDFWELAVIYFDEDNNDNGNEIFSISYDTPITDYVLGYLTDEEVRNYLKQIKKL